MISVKKLFVASANLKGYKSIENVNVDFEPGLNLIIGKNAVGKTNFLNFINNSLNFNFQHFNNFESQFTLLNDENIYKFTFLKASKIQIAQDKSKNDFLRIKKIIPEFKGELKVEDRNNNITSNFAITEDDQCTLFLEQLEYDNIVLKSTFIRHGLPKDYLIVDSPLNIELIDKTISDDFFEYYNSTILNNFSHKLLSCLVTYDMATVSFFNRKLKKTESIQKFLNEKKTQFKADILKNLKFLNELKYLLNEYSPIEDIRINENFLVEIDQEYERVSLKNFYIEYFIDKKWYSFEELSDGTKRLFYIISEIFILERIFLNDKENNILNVIFIEEPELGIHPHQLFKLMKFIKEKSRYSQIIVTTHSPLSLDILEKDELNAIIIADKVEGKTVLTKLSNEKLEKASLYMDELNLSDFWLNSDLED